MSLLDQYGRPAKTTAKPPQDDRRGAPRLVDRYADSPVVGLTPTRLASLLREAESGDVARQARLFAQIYERDSHVRAEFDKRLAAVIGLTWEVSADDDSAPAAEAAAFVEETLLGLPGFAKSLRRLAGAVGYGYALEEVTWAWDGERYLPSLHAVDPQRITFANSLTPLIITDQSPTGEELPPFRAIYHAVQAASGHEIKSGLFRTVAWMYLFKHFGIKDWMIFLEAYGTPYRVGLYDPATTTDEERARLIQAVRSLGVDGAGIISKDSEIKIIEAAGRTGEPPHKPLIELCNAEISKAILGQTLTAEVGTRGSLATAQVHDKVRRDLTTDDAADLAETIQAQLVRPLVGFNLGWDRPLPRFYFVVPRGPEEIRVDAELLGLALTHGFPVTLELYSDRTGLPLPAEGETIMTPPAASALGPSLAHRVAQAVGAPDDHPLGPAIDLAVETAATLDLDAGIRQVVERAESYDDLMELLGQVYGDRPRSEFEDLLAQALLLADLEGRFKEAHP